MKFFHWRPSVVRSPRAILIWPCSRSLTLRTRWKISVNGGSVRFHPKIWSGTKITSFSVFAQYDESWTAYSYPDRYLAGPPGHSKWGGPPGHNKWEGDNRGPPGGRGPPGLVNGPPGRNKHPPGWNKLNDKEPSEDLSEPDKESVHEPSNNDRNNDSDNRSPSGPDGVPDSNKPPENRQCR